MEEQGFSVWVDEKHLRGSVAKGIIQGLLESAKVVVFLTERYLQRSNDMNTNCAKEFNSAVKKGVENLIPVVLEESLLDQKSWYGTVLEYELGHKLYIDFSTQEKVEKNLQELCDEIRK